MLSNATRFRRTAAGTCSIVAPLLMLAADALGSRGQTSQSSFLDAIAVHPGANEASIVVAVYGFLVTVPAVIDIMHLLRDRAVALGHVGGALMLLGLVSFAFVAGTEYINVAASSPAANRDEMLALNERVGGSIGYNIVNSTEIVGYVLGLIVLGVALYRARTVNRVFPVLLIAGAVVRLVGAAQLLTVIVGDALILAAFVAVGVAILRQSDLEWERPPASRSAGAAATTR